MAGVSKVDSNITSLRYALEASLGTLPTTPIWEPVEPNSYADFGGSVTTVPRNPINPSRQRRKGVVTDLDVSGGYTSDVTFENMQALLPGYLFADKREKTNQPVTAVAAAGTYAIADTAGFVIGSLIWAEGFSNSANNGFYRVTGVATDTTVTVAGTLVNETSITTGRIYVIGHQFASATATITAPTTGLPGLTGSGSAPDFTTFGLTPGEWVFVGGDLPATQFATDADNGFKRVRSVSATRIEFDKSDLTMVADAGAGQTIQIFFGKTVIKNESEQSLIVRKSYQLERILGAPDDSDPAELQAEYMTGMVSNELALNMPSASLLTADFSFIGSDAEYVDGPTDLKTGTRPVLGDAAAFNTSSDFSRIKLARVVENDAAPDPLFAFSQEITLNLSNNLTPNKALGFLGNFDITAGTLQVGGSITAYFADIDAVQAVRDNANITLDFLAVKGGPGAKNGFGMDLPLLTLGDGRPNIEQDAPVTLPLTMDAGSGADIDIALDHTALFTYFDYLPDAADV